ncbi:MAG: pyridoxal-5-phosphate-dependent protein subunit beta, partial [Bacteroidota bacterium]
TISKLAWLGVSGISNIISAVKLAKYYEMNENDIIFTIFTDSVELYGSRLDEMNEIWGNYSSHQADKDWYSILKKQSTDNFAELSYHDKKRIHNLKYFTWVEQQGKTVEELNEQWYNEGYWKGKFSIVPVWDKLIEEFNAKVGL